MKKKLKFVLIPLVIVLLAAGWTARYVSLNRFYHSFDDRVKMTYPMGEDVPFGEDYIGYGSADGYLMCVNDFRIVDFEDICPDVEGNTPEKLALVDVTLKNTGSEAEGVMLPEIALYGIDQLLFMNYEALDCLNPVLEGNPGIHLRDNTEYQLTLPYSLYKLEFSHKTWNNLDRYELFLQLTCFPTCKLVRVQ